MNGTLNPICATSHNDSLIACQVGSQFSRDVFAVHSCCPRAGNRHQTNARSAEERRSTSCPQHERRPLAQVVHTSWPIGIAWNEYTEAEPIRISQLIRHQRCGYLRCEPFAPHDPIHSGEPWNLPSSLD